jgi:hypothetical protein
VIRKSLLLALAAMLAVSGCGEAAATPEESETSGQAQGLSTPLPATAETPKPIDKAATEALSGPEHCPPSTAGVAIPPLEDVLNYGDSLVEYLNAQGSVEVLAQQAEALNLLGNLGVPQGYMQQDLNGDDVPEIAISLVDWMEGFSEGRVYVATCEGGEYRLSYTSPERDDFRTAQIDSAFDLTGDGLDDLIISRRGCGAHTCFEWLEVVTWDGQDLENRMEDIYFDLPSTSIEFIGPAADGSYRVEMTGNGVASVGAGPYHRRAVTWEWDPVAFLFRPGELEYLPSEWRIHFVHDADQAFADGDYLLAFEIYDRVIHDDSLSDWPSDEFAPEIAESRPIELAAYARFRRILTSLMMNDLDSAEIYYQDLIDSHPPGEHGEGFAGMGEAFWGEYYVSGNYDLACAAARQVADTMPTSDLAPLDYGYSNPTYTPAEICPASS